MAKYRVETNNGTFEVEADREPTVAEVEAHIASAGGQSPVRGNAPVSAHAAPSRPPASLKDAMAMGLLGNPYGVGGTGGMQRMGFDANPKMAGMVADMGLEAGGGTGGQMLGTATGPLAPVAVPVLGAIGAGGGNALAQFRQMKMGERERFGFGEFFGAVVGGLIPGSPAAKGALKPAAKILKFAKEGGVAAGQNIAAKATENLIDDKPLLTGKEAATAGIGAILGTTIARGLDAGKNPAAIAASIEEAQDAGKRYALKVAKELDLVIPPSMIRSSYPNDVLSSVAGSAAIMREAIGRNQKRFDKLIREDIGMPQTAELFRDPKTGKVPAMESLKVGPDAVYKEVATTSDQAEAALKLFQDQNSKAASLRAQYRDMFPKSDEVRVARDQAELDRKEAAKILEDQLKKDGKPELWDKFEEARKKLAKIKTAEDAMNDATGNFNPSHFGKMWEDSPKLLDGNMEKVGRFWTAFSHVAKDANGQLPVAMNQLNAMAGMVSGDPRVIMTTTGLPRLARDVALSKPYQSRLERFYGPTRQDAPAIMARLAAMSAGRQEQPPPRPVPYR